MQNKIEFRDKILRCCDCGQSFIFSAGEQAFFYSKRLSEPRRCQKCRLERRLRLVPDKEGGECWNCYHRLPNGLCACREPEDMVKAERCPDWYARGGDDDK